jgi:osmotically-inducible protein OsmY
MAKGEGRLVPVDELPRRSRRGKYARVLDDFQRGPAQYARYETDAKPSNVAAALRAAVRTMGADISVKVIGGEVYLAKK